MEPKAISNTHSWISFSFVSVEFGESPLWNLRLRLIGYQLTYWLIFLFSSLPSLIWPSKLIILFMNHTIYKFFFVFIKVCVIYIVWFFVRAGKVCKKWKQGVKESLARKQNLSFSGWKMDDDSTSRLVSHAYNLRKLDMYVFISLSLCSYWW